MPREDPVAMERPFDPRFFESDPLFWPIAPAARAFVDEADWPAVETYARAFAPGTTPPVRFVAAELAPRRRRRDLDPSTLYDARIAGGCVPTRPRSWHDFLNALVWATFPLAKRALHQRQLRALRDAIAPGSRTLPPTRSREHDALALLDEGGLVLLGSESDGESVAVAFGHALYEGIVLERGAMTACALHARVELLPAGAEDRARLADQHLARLLDEAPLRPEALVRGRLPGRGAGAGSTAPAAPAVTARPDP
jgi:hypothetical protein